METMVWIFVFFKLVIVKILLEKEMKMLLHQQEK